MADTQQQENTPPGGREFSEADKKKARAWFQKAADTRDRHDYNYAIESYITGLKFWPEAVEEGHKPLYSLAIQRAQTGGKKPGMMDQMKHKTNLKDSVQAMFNAELLFAKDPTNGKYLDALMRNAALAGLYDTLDWIAPLALDSIKREKKVNTGRFDAYRETLLKAGDGLDELGDGSRASAFYEKALQSIEFLRARDPDNGQLRDMQRDISGKIAIIKGKYAEAETFRDSVRDMEKQRILHDQGQVQQGDAASENLIATARSEYEADPTATNKVNALVDALTRRERDDEEDEASRILLKAYEDTKNYGFKLKADDLRLKRMRREARKVLERLQQGASDDDKQQARLVRAELVQTEVDIFRERVATYPTDLRLKYKLGKALYQAGEFDEAIPVLQAAQSDPRSRPLARVLIGRCFYEKGVFSQAREVLRDALEEHDNLGDERGKEMLYWLANAYAANGEAQEAKDAYGKLLRMDYNYANGDARKRLEELS